MHDAEIEKEPSIGISYNAELPGKRVVVLQSFVRRDGTIDELNGVLDKLRIASERQYAFGIVEVLKQQLEQEMKLAADHAKRMADLDEKIRSDWSRSNRKGDVRLSKSEEQQQQQAYAHAEESKKRIAKVKADIAEFQAKIGPEAQIGA